MLESSPVLETLSLSKQIPVLGFPSALENLSLREKNPSTGISPCTGDESLSEKNALNCSSCAVTHKKNADFNQVIPSLVQFVYNDSNNILLLNSSIPS